MDSGRLLQARVDPVPLWASTETDAELTSQYGMGPAARKVYGGPAGISMGGYGEFYFAAPLEQGIPGRVEELVGQ